MFFKICKFLMYVLFTACIVLLIYGIDNKNIIEKLEQSQININKLSSNNKLLGIDNLRLKNENIQLKNDVIKIIKDKIIISRGYKFKELKMKVTAYCSCEKCCGKTFNDVDYGISASGKKVRNGMVAMGKQYPFGTKVIINNIIYTCEDRGGMIHDDCIDIYMDSHIESLQWGKKYLEVTILN